MFKSQLSAPTVIPLLLLHAWAPSSTSQVGPGPGSVQPGAIATVAGIGNPPPGDGGPATAAQLGSPIGVAVDRWGNVYIADEESHRVRKVVPTGVITTVAGMDRSGSGGDGGPAADAQLNRPSGVAVDTAGNLFIADTWNDRVRKVDPFGVITTVAGTGRSGSGGDGGPATDAQLDNPSGVAVDAAGNLFIADTWNDRVRKVDPFGVITTVAGTGRSGFGGDGGPATDAQLDNPSGVAVDAAGNLFIADRRNHRVRRVDRSGVITTVAGTGRFGSGGDSGPATSAPLAYPSGVAVDGAGNLLIAESPNDRVRRVDRSGVITTVAGTGRSGSGGDGGPAASAQLNEPHGVAVDGLGNLYIADRDNHRVRKVDASGVITTVAGTDALGSREDGGPATRARVAYPSDVAVDAAGNLYIAEWVNDRVRRVDAFGVITTVAGSGRSGFGGDGGPATDAQLDKPSGVAVDGLGNLYIADTDNHRVRKVDTSGVITTVAGTGEEGSGGDGGPAASAQLNEPHGVAVDGLGNLYIADHDNHRVRKVDPAGVITTVAGTGALGFREDGGPATSAPVAYPSDVAVDAAGNLYIAEWVNDRVSRVDPAGVITTVAGTSRGGYSGDGGPATSAQLDNPSGVAVDGLGNLYIADRNNHRVRRIAVLGGGTTTPPVVADDHGNDASGATRLSLGSSRGGRIGTPGDEDWFRLETGGPRHVRIGTTGSLDTVGTLFDESGKKLASDDDGGDGLNFALQATVAAGVYYVRVNGHGSATGSYTIQEQGRASGELAGQASRYRIDTLAGTSDRGDAGPATEAQLDLPDGVAVDNAGNLYIADTHNDRIRKVDAAGTITTIVGTGEKGFKGDGGPAPQARLRAPRGVAVDGAGNLYVADTGNNRIRKVDSTGTISTVAGSDKSGFGGDGGAAIEALLNSPMGVAVDGAGNLYIADSGNDRIRRVDVTRTITTIAGTGQFTGDGGSAPQARLRAPRGVAVDKVGNLYIADTRNHRIRRVDAAATITTVAGTKRAIWWKLSGGGFRGDGGPAVRAQLYDPSGVAVDRAGNVYIADAGNSRIRKVDSSGTITLMVDYSDIDSPYGVAVDGAGNLYIADSGNHRIRRVDAAGAITTVAGTGERGFSGDGGPAIQAQFIFPTGVAVDGAGNLYIADAGNDRIRRVDPAGTVTTIAGTGKEGFGGDGSPASQAQLDNPRGVAVDGAGNLFIADSGNQRIRKVDSTGTIVTIAGSGESGFGGDGGPAIQAKFHYPSGVAVDAAGNVYVADRDNDRIRKLTPLGGSGETGAPDLVVQGSSVSASSLDEGASFTLRATVRNQGTRPSGATTLRYYRSSNVDISALDTEVGTEAIGSLSASGTSAASISLAAPSSAGTYFYGACVEAVSGESDTRNNCSGGLRVNVSASLLPDQRNAPMKMYWTADGPNKIQRANLDGTEMEDLVTGLSGPRGLALDLGAGKMYWTAYWAGKIQRANLDGTEVEDLVTSGLNGPHALALDPGAGKMYWTDVGTGRIRRANLDGNQVEDLTITGLVGTEGLALDLRAGKMYWTAWEGRIRRANLDGSQTEDLASTGDGGPSSLALDLDAGKMYWTALVEGKIRRANLDGSGVEQLVTTGLLGPSSLALDPGAGKMYWADESEGKIRRANLDGTQVEDLVTGVSQIPGLALDLGN